jgi:glycosyltransferase involved in cell wall biosynthesis
LTVVEAQAAGLPCVLSDTISGETKISPLVTFVSLTESAAVWAGKVLAAADGGKRPDMTEDVRQAGYDSADSAARLTSFYSAALERRKL